MIRRFGTLSSPCKVKSYLSIKKYFPVDSILRYQRHFSTSNQETKDQERYEKISNDVEYTPPYPVRIALVSTTVGLCTPLFATLGVGMLWYSYLPKTEVGCIGKNSLGVVMGGGGATLFYQYVFPFLQCHSEVILPFALANAVVSGVWYSVAEEAFGLKSLKAEPPQQINLFDTSSSDSKNATSHNISQDFSSMLRSFSLNSKVPLIGAGIGALTALTSPLLWPIMFQVCFPDPAVQHLLHMDDSSWLLDLYSWIALPIGVPIGILAGLTLHSGLHSSVVGVHDIPWKQRSLRYLIALLLLAALYFTMCRSSTDDYFYERRQILDVTESFIQTVSVNLKTGEIRRDQGAMANWAGWIHSMVRLVTILRSPYGYYFPTSNKSNTNTTSGRWLKLLQNDINNDINTNMNNNDNNKSISRNDNIRISADEMMARRELFLLSDLLLLYIRLKKEEVYLQEVESKLQKLHTNISSPPSASSSNLIMLLKVLSLVWPVASIDLVLRYLNPEQFQFRSEYVPSEVVSTALVLSLLANAYPRLQSLLSSQPPPTTTSTTTATDIDISKNKNTQIESLKNLESSLAQTAKLTQLTHDIRSQLIKELKKKFNIIEFDMDEYMKCLEVTIANKSNTQSNTPKSTSGSYFALSYQKTPQSLEKWLELISKKHTNSMPGELPNVSSQLLKSTDMILSNLDYVQKELSNENRVLSDKLYENIDDKIL